MPGPLRGSIGDAILRIQELVRMLDAMALAALDENPDGPVFPTADELAEAHALAIDVWECL